MSEDVEEAFETKGLIIGEDTTVGIFSGGVLPHVAVPDAPRYSLYHRTNGDIFKLTGIDGSEPSDWEIQGSSVLELNLIFFNSNGVRDDISISSFDLPFYNSDGTQDNIKII